MRDQKTENYLNDGQYAHEFRAKVPIKSIDLVGARINPARAHRRIDPDRVTAYGIAMLDGTEFPAIVVFDHGGPLLDLVTGLHRLEAAIDAKLTDFDAYVVVEPVEYRRDLLRRAINSIEGSAPTQQEQLKHAAEMLRLHPSLTSIKDVAAAFKLSDFTLATFLRVTEADERALQLGVFDQFCSLTQTIKLELYGIQNDHNFVGAIGVIANYNLRGGEADAFAKEVKRARSEAAGHTVIEKKQRDCQQRDQRAKAKHSKTKRARSTKFISAAKTLARMGPLPALGLDGIEPGDLYEGIEAVEQAIDLMTRSLKWMQHRLEENDRKNAWERSRGTRGERLSETDLHAT
jgi:hypothetical protein